MIDNKNGKSETTSLRSQQRWAQTIGLTAAALVCVGFQNAPVRFVALGVAVLAGAWSIMLSGRLRKQAANTDT